MRNIPVVSAFLAAFLVAAVALAANDKVVISFVSQQSSGVKGDVTLESLPQGQTMIHARLAGLDPNVDYVSRYFTDGTCSSGSGTEIAAYKANPMGKAVFSARVGKSIGDLKSISVQLKSDLSLKACASNP